MVNMIIMFGGSKFKDWKEKNPGRLSELYLESNGNATTMEDNLINETKGECDKQIREFMMKAHELGYFHEGTNKLEDQKKRENQQRLNSSMQNQQQVNNNMQNQQRLTRNMADVSRMSRNMFRH